MSERVRVNVTPTPDFVGFYPSSRQKVIDMLATALQVRHGIRDGHQRG